MALGGVPLDAEESARRPLCQFGWLPTWASILVSPRNFFVGVNYLQFVWDSVVLELFVKICSTLLWCKGFYWFFLFWELDRKSFCGFYRGPVPARATCCLTTGIWLYWYGGVSKLGTPISNCFPTQIMCFKGIGWDLIDFDMCWSYTVIRRFYLNFLWFCKAGTAFEATEFKVISLVLLRKLASCGPSPIVPSGHGGHHLRWKWIILDAFHSSVAYPQWNHGIPVNFFWWLPPEIPGVLCQGPRDYNIRFLRWSVVSQVFRWATSYSVAEDCAGMFKHGEETEWQKPLRRGRHLWPLMIASTL